MVWSFAALCVISAIARVIGQIGMVRLGQRAVSDLSMQIVRRALKLPLRAFEAIDTSGLLAVLTEDIVLIANALTGIPHLCINAPILIACLIYIGWLSPLIFVCGVVFAVPAIAISVILSSMGVQKAATSASASGRPRRPFPHADRRFSRAQAPSRAP